MTHDRYIGLAAVVLALSAALATDATHAQRARSGKEVVNAVCIKCHGTGEHGAPRIGDNKAWQARTPRGLSSLNQTAIEGLRSMPPHGGRLDLSDLELKRAITHMVNRSGGHWVEPADTQYPVARTGRQVVEARCRQCHEAGKGGAPRIGDRAAWIPRLSHGFEPLVRSAIHGHGGMPARGGLPDLTDDEMRGAIVYMFNPDPVARK
jgi:cytochrome c5